MRQRRMRGIGTPGAGLHPGAGIPAGSGGNALQGSGLWFTYVTAALASLADGATSTAQALQFDANSVFLWLRSSFTAQLSGPAAFTYSSIPIPNINVSISNTTGVTLMNNPVPVYQVGSPVPGLSYILPTPQLVQANSTYQWTYTNFDGSDTYYNLQWQLHGFRIFDPNIQTLAEAYQALGFMPGPGF